MSERHNFRSNPVNARVVKTVIPTYKNWEGLRIASRISSVRARAPSLLMMFYR